MPRIILRTAPGRDEYVIWSTVVDTYVLGPGTRDQVAHHLSTEWPVRLTDAAVQEILARVDGNGSSDRIGKFGWWDGEPLPVGEGAPDDGRYELPRDRLAAYVDAVEAGDEKAAQGLLVCWHRYDDEDDD